MPVVHYRFFPATERQLELVRKLAAERVANEMVAHTLSLPRLDKTNASFAISELLKAPRKR
jgi:hypothetical protein